MNELDRSNLHNSAVQKLDYSDPLGLLSRCAVASVHVTK